MTGLASLPLEAAIALAAMFGCMIGSFLNVVAHRLPAMVLAECDGDEAPFTLSFPASHCPSCETPLGWIENVPLLSWLAQRGRCRHCAAPISWRYPLLEALGALAAALAVWRFGVTVDAALAAGVLLALLALAVIDAETGLLPDRITLPLLWAGLIAAGAGYGPGALQAAAAAAAGYLAFEGLNLACRLMTGRDGMGGGDSKLAAAMGAWLGPFGLAWALLAAFAAGALYGLAKKASKLSDQSSVEANELPFGPWLAGSAAAFTLWPELADIAGGWVAVGSF